MHKLHKIMAISAISLVAGPSWATPFSATIPDMAGPIYSEGGAVSWYMPTVSSPGESGINQAMLSFELIGYGGIDGYGPRINNNDVFDEFSFRTGWGATTRNGTPVDTYFNVDLNMGGANPGAPNFGGTQGNVTITSYVDNGPGLGGVAHFVVPFTLLSGDNRFVFQYGCCSYANGTEEAWGIRNIRIMADIAPVPEPGEWSMMLAGLMAMGAQLRKRRHSA